MGLVEPQYAIELRGINVFRLGKRILHDVHLCVPKHACCAVMGPNGSGKSSLISIVSGYDWPSSGQVRVNGHVFGHVPLDRVRQGIGLIEPSRSPEFAPGMRVRDLVATGLFGTICLPLHHDITDAQWARVDEEIERLGLTALKNAPFSRLSTGERMKGLIARAMLSDPALLLLDEPSVGLDMGSRARLMQQIDGLRDRVPAPTVVVVTHHLDELPLSVDHVVLLKDGSISAQGRPDEVLTSKRLSDLFSCSVHVTFDHGRFVASVR
jgi:iron complex transport system ATP-binding protein